MLCGFREVVLPPICVPDSVERVLEPGAQFRQIFHALFLFPLCFVAPEQKLFYGNILLPDSVERVLEPGA